MGRDNLISHFSRWLERGQERTLEPVLRPAEVNEVLSLHFNRLSLACSLSALISHRPLEMLGRMLEPRHRDTSAFFIACLWHIWSHGQNHVFLRSFMESTGRTSAVLVGSTMGLGSGSGLADALASISGEAKCHTSCSRKITRREKEACSCDHMYIGKDG